MRISSYGETINVPPLVCKSHAIVMKISTNDDLEELPIKSFLSEIPVFLQWNVSNLEHNIKIIILWNDRCLSDSIK